VIEKTSEGQKERKEVELNAKKRNKQIGNKNRVRELDKLHNLSRTTDV